MKILITGYKGFIGQNMVNNLKEDHELSFYEWGETIPTVKGLDLVIHLGAISSTTESNVEKVIEQNYDFSRWILGECHTNQVAFQFSSSASVYGFNKDFKETAPVDPKTPYAWSKFLFERYVKGFSGKWNCRVQGFRYFNVYGPHEDHKGEQASIFYKFEESAKNTGIIKLFENSDQYFRDFVPVKTVVDVHKRFFTVEESGVWNVGTGIATSVQTVAEEIAKKYNATLEYIPIPENLRAHYQKYTCADLTNLNRYYP